MDPDKLTEAKRISLMHTKLTAYAWRCLRIDMLQDAIMAATPKYTEEEREFVDQACIESGKILENFDSFFEGLINDHAGIALFQAAMSPHIDNMNEL